jgi:subtilisin family serine protease
VIEGTGRGAARAALFFAHAVVTVAAGAGAAGAATARVAAQQTAVAPRPTGRLLAILSSKGARPIERVAARNGLRVGERVPSAGLLAVAPGPGQSRAGLRRELLADPLVERVDTEYYRELRYLPNDPAYNSLDPGNAPNGDRVQWNLRRQGFETAWSFSKGAAAKVAIVDTGVSATSPDLGQIAAADDHDPTPTGALNDENGHGTHVAGLACANSDNGYGIASAGFDCQIIAEKLDVSGNSLTDASVIAGINAAVARGADVINMSFGGGGQSTAMRDAIYNAWAHNVVLVAAAENTATTDQGYPARYVVPNGAGPNLATCAPGDTTSIGCSRGVVVTMAQYNDTAAGGGHGSGVSLAAYGDSMAPKPGIFSTFPQTHTTLEPGICLNPTCAPRANFGGDTRFAYLFGTSMATPQVSGLAALIRSATPGRSAAQVVQAIKRTARGGGVWSDSLGFGVIDAGKAMAVATGADVTPPSSRVRSPRHSRSRTFTLTIERSDSDPFGLSSGIDNVAVFVATARGGYRLLRKTGDASITFRGKRHTRYSFYSRALDKAGNREPAPLQADSVTGVRRKKR